MPPRSSPDVQHGPRSGAPHSPNRSRVALPALTGGVLVAICLVFTFVLAAWHSDVARVLGGSGQSVAAAVAQGVDGKIEVLDFSLRGVVERWNLPGLRALPAGLLSGVLFDNAIRAPGFGAVTVLDARGIVVARSTGMEGVGTPLGDRDYFRVHAGARDVGLYVSKPYRSRVSGQWCVALSRRIDEAGEFAGIVVGTLDLEFLEKLYGGLGIGSDNAVTLFRTDGTVILREPFVASDVRLWAGGNDSFNRMRASRDGTFEGPSPIDGQSRIISFHRVGTLPLIQAVEVGGEADYAAWWRRATAVAGLLTLLCLGVLALSLLLGRELGLRSAAEAELARLAETDALTGLANRRRFSAEVSRAWSGAGAVDAPLALLMADVDAFKAFNDILGHAAGDEALRAVAAALDACARDRGGLACRWGGEEFAVLLPGRDEAGAMRAAEAMCAAVRSLALPHPRGASGIVTLSIGVAVARSTGGDGPRDALMRADAALYRAKAEGRDRCRGEAAPTAAAEAA